MKKIALGLFILPLSLFAQTNFEGMVRYRYTSYTLTGDIVGPPVEIEDSYYSSSKKITKVVQGYFNKVVGEYFLFIDLEKNSRFEVWNWDQKIKDLGVEEKHDIYFYVKKTDIKEEILLEY